MVEPVSIDEGYLDISECAELGSPLDIANSIQERIFNTMDLPCSIGIAPNKFLAKTASDMKKPMGITVLRKRDIPEKLWPLQVGEMHGIGDKTSEKLQTIGIKTIRDLAHANDRQLKQLLGINGIRLKDRANGIDPRVVDPEAIFEHKSIGNSTTLPHDSANQKELIGVLEKLSGKVAVRLRNKRLLGQKIGVTIRYKDRRTITRSRTVPNPVFEKKDILDGAIDLFMKNWNGEGIRLLGVTAYDVIEKESAFKQLDIFSFQEDAEKEPLYEAMEHLQNKYGENIIKKGLPLKNRSIGTDTSFSKDFFEQSRRNDPSFDKD
jgi:DNA polymerase-4